LAREADAVLSGRSLDPLIDALSPALHREAQSGIRAGEQLVQEHGPSAAYPLPPQASWLAFWLARTREEPRWLATSDSAQVAAEASTLIPALPYASRAAPAHAAPTAMPAESVLEMLRTQLVPKARACLRDDRKGRADYAVGLAFHAVFAHREVSDVAVEGDIPTALRTCLEALFPRLRVPAFSGTVRVRYPIHTAREPPPPTVELTPELEEHVRRVLAAPAPGRSAHVRESVPKSGKAR
jgi:hypothetical protein